MAHGDCKEKNSGRVAQIELAVGLINDALNHLNKYSIHDDGHRRKRKVAMTFPTTPRSYCAPSPKTLD